MFMNNETEPTRSGVELRIDWRVGLGGGVDEEVRWNEKKVPYLCLLTSIRLSREIVPSRLVCSFQEQLALESRKHPVTGPSHIIPATIPRAKEKPSLKTKGNTVV